MNMAWRNKRDIERKMTTRDFMEYPNASADVDSLEEVVMYQQSGRKAFSPIVEVEEEEEDSDGEGRRAAVAQRKGTSPREQQSSQKSSTSPLSPSSSGHSSPRSPPHPPPPTSHPPPLPAQQQGYTSMVTNKSRPSHASNPPKMSGSAINQFPSQDRQNEHPRTAHTHGSRTKGGHFGPRGQAGGKTHTSETHHQSADSKVMQPTRNSPGTKPSHFGSDGHHFGSEPKHSSKLLSEQSSLESTPMSSEASTPINEFHNDQSDRGSPSGASSTSLNSLRQQDTLQTSVSDMKLSPYHHRDFAGDLSGLESRSDNKLRYASTLPKRSESFSGSTAKQHATTSVSQLQTAPRHQFGKLPPTIPEKSSLASVSFNYPQQASYAGSRQHQRPTVALRVSQFNQNGNQNGNHSGGTTRSSGQGQSTGSSGQGGGGRTKASPVDDKRGVKWRKEKTPSPGNAKSPENTVGFGNEDRGSRVRGGGGEGKRESAPGMSPNLAEVSPSSSMEELSEINVPVNENETDSAPLVKPHVHKSSPHYSPYLPPPPPPPPPAHLSEPQYPYDSPYDPYVRPDLQTANSSKHPHHKLHPAHGYPPPHDYTKRFPVPTSKGLRTEQHMKSSISLAHEAAAKGDVIQLHHMLTNQEIDPMMLDEHNSTLAHKAAMNGHVNVLSFLIKDRGLPISGLQIPDENFTTPAMLAIQAGHVDCLQWLVEEGRVPLQVKDTGGETLMHHAAFHGQVKCLEWLLLSIKKNEDQPKEILDDCGVMPAHFAALEGHLDCLQLLMDLGYSVVLTDDKNQKPLNWADAKGRILCVRYLMMYETCWDLSSKVAHLVERLQILQKQNEQLREGLSLQEQDHQMAMSKLQQQHEEKVAKMREHYVDLTVSMLNMKERENLSQSSVGGGGGGGGATNKPKSQVPVRRAPPEPGSSQRGRTKPPPIPLDMGKRRGVGRGGEGGGDWDDHDGIEYRTATPQEVLEKQMTSVAQRMSASREARKRQISAMTVRPFSPLSPVVQRMYSYRQEEDMKGSERQRPQRHSESHGDRRPKVKFSSTVTEFPDYSWPLESDRHSDDGTRSTSKSSSGHGSSGHGGSGHTSSGHGGSGHGSTGHGGLLIGHGGSGHGGSGHGGSGYGGAGHSFSGHGGSAHGSSGHGGSGHGGLGHGNLGHGSSHSPSQTPGHSPAHSGTSGHGVSGYSGVGSGHKQLQDRSVPDGGEAGQAKAEAILYPRNSDFRRDSSQYPS